MWAETSFLPLFCCLEPGLDAWYPSNYFGPWLNGHTLWKKNKWPEAVVTKWWCCGAVLSTLNLLPLDVFSCKRLKPGLSCCHFPITYCSSIGEGNGTPLQYSCLENPMDGGAWWAAVHGVARSRTLLSDFTFTFHFHALEKEMATHSSVLAWRIPGTGSLVGCCLWGHTESDTTEVT